MRETTVEVFGRSFTVKPMNLKVRVNFNATLRNIAKKEAYGTDKVSETTNLKYTAIRESVVVPPELSKNAKEEDFWEFFHDWEKGGEAKLNDLTGEMEYLDDNEGINGLLAFEELFEKVSKYNIEGRVAELEKKSLPSEEDLKDSTKQ